MNPDNTPEFKVTALVTGLLTVLLILVFASCTNMVAILISVGG